MLVGLGGLLTGGGTVLGTGAFTTVEAERTVSVETAGDANAFLGIQPGSEGDEYIIEDENGQIGISITSTSVGGQGVNQNAITAVDQLLQVTNNGKNKIVVGFNNDYARTNGDYENIGGEPPGGWGYVVSDDKSAAAVVWASPLPGDDAMNNKSLSEIRPELVTTGFAEDSTLVDRTPYNVADEVELRSERMIEPDSSLNIGIIIDTRDNTVENNPLPDELNNVISLYAEVADN